MVMNQREQKDRQNSPEDVQSKGKKPYVKPEVRFERVFETLALSCGKVQVTQSTCVGNRSAS